MEVRYFRWKFDIFAVIKYHNPFTEMHFGSAIHLENPQNFPPAAATSSNLLHSYIFELRRIFTINFLSRKSILAHLTKVDRRFEKQLVNLVILRAFLLTSQTSDRRVRECTGYLLSNHKTERQNRMDKRGNL